MYFSVALSSALLGFAFQFASVMLRYEGNWTGLFCTGSLQAVPPQLAREEIVLHAGTRGYDGQMYHYVAHDPLLRTDIQRYIDDARLRYRRILLPALAQLLALGKQQLVDAGFIAANLIFLFSGAWWLSRYLHISGLGPKWGVLFVLTPATVVAIDRLTVDLTLTALCVGAALYWRTGESRKLLIVLALACLTRDTGFFLMGAFVLASALRGQPGKAAAYSITAFPAVIWYVYVALNTHGRSYEYLSQLIPFKGVVGALIAPLSYPFSGAVQTVLTSLDRVALLGVLLAVLFALKLLERNGAGPIELAMLLWAVTAICMPRDALIDCVFVARIFSPLIVYLALIGIPVAGWRMGVPLLAVLPRIAVEAGAPLIDVIVN